MPYSDKAVSPCVYTPAVADAAGWALDAGLELTAGGLLRTPPPVAYLYFRIYISALWSTYAILHAFDLYDSTGRFSPRTMTSDSSGGFVASASSEFSASFKPFLAFDNDPTNRWTSDTAGAPQWLKLQLPVAKVLTRYSLEPFYSFLPKTWVVEGSNTGEFVGEQTALSTVTNYTWAAELADSAYTPRKEVIL